MVFIFVRSAWCVDLDSQVDVGSGEIGDGRDSHDDASTEGISNVSVMDFRRSRDDLHKGMWLVFRPQEVRCICSELYLRICITGREF